MIEDIIPVLEMMLRKGENMIGGADHDVIYGPSEVTDEERQLLEKHHWHYDSGIDCWCKFV